MRQDPGVPAPGLNSDIRDTEVVCLTVLDVCLGAALATRVGMSIMRLPNVGQADIPQPKLTEYLLSPTHRTGRTKAAFFARFGFTRETWEALAAALRDHAVDCNVVETETTAYGTIYTVEGALSAPDGRAPKVRVVWFIKAGESVPRLVTAYPIKGAK